ARYLALDHPDRVVAVHRIDGGLAWPGLDPSTLTVVSPDVRILATEEEQAGNVYAAVYLNLTEETAPLFRYAQAYGL
ncbi:hypothetical protein IAE22_36025, partial [Bacillus sp. S34]|nr:hypothetical protein [Bacillus sp. S34]